MYLILSILFYYSISRLSTYPIPFYGWEENIVVTILRKAFQGDIGSWERIRDFLNCILMYLQVDNGVIMYEKYNIRLYCINGVVIAVQCTATFLRSTLLPEFRY